MAETSEQNKHRVERIQRLNKYVEQMKNKLVADVSTKHQSNPEAIRSWVRREIVKAEKTIESLKLS